MSLVEPVDKHWITMLIQMLPCGAEDRERYRDMAAHLMFDPQFQDKVLSRLESMLATAAQAGDWH